MNPVVLDSFHGELEKIALDTGGLAAAIGGSILGGEVGHRLSRSALGGKGMLPITLATSLGGSIVAGDLYRQMQIRKIRKRMREQQKQAFVQKPLFTMTHSDLTKERTRLTREFYKGDRKTPAIAGVSGAVVAGAMSKALLGKGMIPAAVVGGMISAQAASSIKRKKLLRRIKDISNRMRYVSAPVSAARRKG
jgi:hypothetical protein